RSSRASAEAAPSRFPPDQQRVPDLLANGGGYGVERPVGGAEGRLLEGGERVAVAGTPAFDHGLRMLGLACKQDLGGRVEHDDQIGCWQDSKQQCVLQATSCRRDPR